MTTPKITFYLIFILSGFAGLIYESIWSHYLKLFLGHAAYAQTLVLAIFMGGMAIGAALSARYSPGWKNLLLGYALVEGIIGFFAIVFHNTFINTTELTFDIVIPFLNESPILILSAKWGLGIILILPQSILLGMTFPLMVSGILRRYPGNEGRTISTLYFTNSIGAVFGVLASSFLLIDAFGLPGTILSAGLINIALALVVWAISKNDVYPIHSFNQPPAILNNETELNTLPFLLLMVAFLTGLSSFLYEIAWIRMLSLVMGSSTHSFELMLAAFILGIALGGLWLRKRIDQLSNPKQFLGYVQIAMGLMALLSIWLYHSSFDVMQAFMGIIQKSESAYPVYLFVSAAICLLMMLPATFCAGMTLPLATKLMSQTHYRERSIGAIYASNTLGAIIGIFLAVHILMPAFGLKSLITIGAGIDILLGLILLNYFLQPNLLRLPRSSLIIGFTSLILFAVSVFIAEFDNNRLVSGVYRHGGSTSEKDILLMKHGKTSSVSVYKTNGNITIANNGKPDASISLDKTKPSGDDFTQVLLGLLPLAHYPTAENAAIIGLGSGITPESVLASDNIKSVDSIEIESAVVDGSRLFEDRVYKTHNDPRSRIYVDDAKTFFSTRDYKYDIIVSEPPNPWVSGVSSLFTQEFYHRIKNHINDDGLFIQWLHLYEINTPLVATVFNALGKEFSDYMVYIAHNNVDVIIVASKNGPVPPLSKGLFLNRDIAEQLSLFDINSIHDFKIFQVADKETLHPLLNSIQRGVNSDYFPVLDNNAAKTRFARASATNILSIMTHPIPIRSKRFTRQGLNTDQLTESVKSRPAASTYHARMLYNNYMGGSLPDSNLDRQSSTRWSSTLLLKQLLKECEGTRSSLSIKAIHNFALSTLPYLEQDKLVRLWLAISSDLCPGNKNRNLEVINLVELYISILHSDHKRTFILAETMLLKGQDLNNKLTDFLIVSAMHSSIYIPGITATQTWEKWRARYKNHANSLAVQLILSKEKTW